MKYETDSYIVRPRIIHSREAKPTFCYVEQTVYGLLSNMVHTYSVAHSFIHIHWQTFISEKVPSMKKNE